MEWEDCWLRPSDVVKHMEQEEVQGVLEKAPHLEKLVELYAGPNRLTARQQNQKLQAIADTLPTHVAPEMTDFMQKALLTLQVWICFLSAFSMLIKIVIY